MLALTACTGTTCYISCVMLPYTFAAADSKAMSIEPVTTISIEGLFTLQGHKPVQQQ